MKNIPKSCINCKHYDVEQSLCRKDPPKFIKEEIIQVQQYDNTGYNPHYYTTETVQYVFIQPTVSKNDWCSHFDSI